MNRKVISIFLVLFFALPLFSKDDNDSAGKELLAAVRKTVGLRSDGSPPFLLKAKITLLDLKPDPVEGTYILVWNSPTEWREEISFPGHIEVRVATGDRLWISRPADFTPYRIWQLGQLIDISTALRLTSNEEIRKVKKKKSKGQVLQCIDIRGKKPKAPRREICIGNNAQMLLRETRKNKDTDDGVSEYSSFSEWGQHKYPQRMQFRKDNRSIIEVQVESLSELKIVPDSAFIPPINSQSSSFCDKKYSYYLHAERTHSVNPKYPVSSRRNRQQGTVEIFAIIDTDGTVKYTEVISSAGSAMDQSTLKAIKQWVYTPIICNGEPQEQGTLITVRYRMN